MTDAEPAPSIRGRRRHRAVRWRMPWLAFGIAVIFVLGAAVLLAPTIANWFSQLEQAHQLSSLGDDVAELEPTARERAIAAAHDYNAALIGGALVGANERIPTSEGTASIAGYDELLRADSRGLMARLRIPGIGVDLPVYHGTSDEVLETGLGHLEGTALPVGGVGTRSVITGHRGLASSELFTHLDQVEAGDVFTIEVFGEVLSYRVVETEVVAPDDTRAVYPDANRDLVTLVTCTPLGINSHRILVTGQRVLPTPERDLARAGDPPTIPGFPWWIVILSLVVLAASTYVALAGRTSRRHPSSTT